HDGGAPTYATFYVPSFLEKASAFLTAPCFVVGLVSSERNATVAREACAKTGAEFWWYGTGSYVNPFPQEGFMWHNRYGAGLLFWKTGAKCEATWTFCRPHEDVFNDFDGSRANGAEPKEQATAYPHLLKPDDYSTWQETIPTIAWESLREGVDDYCYLYTLTQLIKQAQASDRQAVRDAATTAQAELEALVNTVPWANPMGGVGFESKRLQQVRQMVSQRIISLQAALSGHALAPERLRPQKLTLRLETSDALSQQPLPALPLPTAVTAPTIDGNLDEPAWKDATVVLDFRDIRDGAPATLNTRALAMSDDQALYIGIDCPEPAMAKVATKETQHDGTVWLEDGVEVFVAGASREPYAHIIVTTANVVLDERNQDATAWNPRLQTAVHKRPDGWSVELALPWAELARAGVQRTPLMALNLCRSRYTAGDPQTHTAWSATYHGFHVPERFGLMLLPTSPLALECLYLPDRWGRQVLRATMANVGGEPVTAEVALDREQSRAALAPGQRLVSPFALPLYRAGSRSLSFRWGVADGPAAEVTLPVTVPEPVEVPTCGGLFSPGSTVNVPVRLNLSDYDQQRYKLRVQLSSGSRSLRRTLAAAPGQLIKMPVLTNGPLRLQIALLNPLGREVWQSPEYTLMVLPE
ncbi:MAG: carbohydrate-binding family 9-like protein, partial [Armatimonadetes bacterium]|nr:carbohydrate-binding family 9-like protein [Armatimonadota bacterium]